MGHVDQYWIPRVVASETSIITRNVTLVIYWVDFMCDKTKWLLFHDERVFGTMSMSLIG